MAKKMSGYDQDPDPDVIILLGSGTLQMTAPEIDIMSTLGDVIKD